VFIGDVVAIRGEGNHGLTIVTFNVVEAFKGVRPGSHTLRIPSSGFDGYNFLEESVRVLVVAFRDGENFSTACTLTRVGT
jgi:hypothetical protein